MMMKANISVRPLTASRARRAVAVRAQAPEDPVQPVQPAQPAVAAVSAQQAADEQFRGQVLNTANEAINGRAAMLGFVSAVAAEAATHHTVFSQLAGKYVDEELVEKAFAGSDLGYFAVVALVTMGTLAPMFIKDERLDSRSVGPFTPAAEKLNGRLAMVGFAGLIIFEAVKGSSLL